MKIIVNADDYGLDQSATEGILTLAKNEKLSSVSIMANLASEDDLRNISLYTKTISTGIHITLNEGKPVTDPSKIASLVGSDGCFYSSSKLWQKVVLGQVKASEINVEIQNQLARLYDFNIEVSHADSHQHLHQYPFLGTQILESVAKNGIKRARRSLPESSTDFRRKILVGFHAFSKNNLKPFNSPDVLITSFAHQKEANLEMFKKVVLDLRKSGQKVVELMCHPALSNREDSYLNRTSEFDFLLNAPWQEFLAKEGIELISYKSLF